MKNKLGFTLVEMIAVVVIISLLTLAVVPSILRQVNDESTEVSKLSEQIIFSAADLYVTDNSNEYLMVSSDTYCITLETLVNEKYLDYPLMDIASGNEIPLNNYVQVDVNQFRDSVYTITDTCVQSTATVIAGNYTDDCVVNGKCTIDDIRTGVSLDVAVSGEYGNVSAVSYSFNVIADDGEYLTLMLNDDSSLSSFSSDYNTSGPVTIFNTLDTITSTWSNIEDINDYEYEDSTSSYTYGYNKVEIANGSTVITNKSGTTTTINSAKARVATAEELVNIIQDVSWNKTNVTSYSSSTPSWVIYSTSGSISSYLTMSSKADEQDKVWAMSYGGHLSTTTATESTLSSLKPVIKIRKAKVQNYVASIYVGGNASNDCVTDSTCSITDIRSGVTVDVAISGTYGTESQNIKSFNVIADDGVNVTLMLTDTLDLANSNDDLISFNSSTTDGPQNILTSLNVTTSTWSNIPSIVSYQFSDSEVIDTYGYGNISIIEGQTTVINKSGTEVLINGNTKARIITADEIANIINDSSWDNDTVTSYNTETPSWLILNLSSGGTTDYLTLNSYPTSDSLSWIMSYDGSLNTLSTSSTSTVRPVIVLTKTSIS